MGRWSRAEIERAFKHYQAMGLLSARTGDWTHWGQVFTDDVTYDEHQLGRWGGQAAVIKNMAAVMHMTGDEADMSDPAVKRDRFINMPWLFCNQYPCEDFVVDEDRGWVWALIWNRMDDPGDGSIHQANCFNLFKYAGRGRFSFEQDLYNPLEFQEMMANWVKAVERCGVDVDRAERHVIRAAEARAALGVDDLSTDDLADRGAVHFGGGGWSQEPEVPADAPVRAPWDKRELQQAYDEYVGALNRSARTADWSHLGARFMPDATFIETVLGRWAKREAIVREIGAFMHQSGRYPWVFLNRYVPEAQVIDDERGWVWAKLVGRFDDPGDGSRHEAEIFVLLKYKQDGLFKSAETIYNPNEFKAAMSEWKKARDAAATDAEATDRMLAERQARAQAQAPLQLDDASSASEPG
ncbi:MAG: hypothetical protein HKN26_11845 [Acidimicrobiales bacterium]|nr:hypothetical protein [Acidimicrobiales bacterium]